MPRTRNDNALNYKQVHPLSQTPLTAHLMAQGQAWTRSKSQDDAPALRAQKTAVQELDKETQATRGRANVSWVASPESS